MFFSEMSGAIMWSVLWGVLTMLVVHVCGSRDHIISRHNVGTVFKKHHVPIIFNLAHIDMTLAIPYKLKRWEHDAS